LGELTGQEMGFEKLKDVEEPETLEREGPRV
jgi:hypothetical protein